MEEMCFLAVSFLKMGKDSAARIELLDYLHVLCIIYSIVIINSKYMHMGVSIKAQCSVFFSTFITDFFFG